MSPKPWYTVVTPREDLRDGKPLDAAEFAVHLDQVRDGRAPSDYQDPVRFFERTYLTQNLTSTATEVVRRLSGERTETSAVFNLATQFGGGKTHALALLYHLAKGGPRATRWQGVQKILDKAGVMSVPEAAVAVFVGTEFDSITGRGGTEDGTPVRYTPWGEIAFQLGGESGYSVVAKHEQERTAPGGDVIRKFLPKGKPCLILVDELMNYISRNRKSGLAAQLYDFLQNLSEVVRGQDKTVLVVAIPSSDQLEVSTPEDQQDYERIKKMLDRLGKAVIMSAETETSEIIRRRLFEWTGLSPEAKKICAEYADWAVEHRQQLPAWFSADNARQMFEASYPFHPSVLSVFERKWQTLPRFQRTRGVLRLLALWVSRAYSDGYKGGQRETLIGLGSAPLNDAMFRAAVLEQLGEPRMESAITTDITGSPNAHAMRLDAEAVDAIRRARLHQKVATSIFFESNGGMVHGEATVPEIRLSVSEPGLDIGNTETALEGLGGACYFLIVERNRYRFSLTPNLNKLLVDRLATVAPDKIKERMHSEVEKVFDAGKNATNGGVERIYFPERSGQIPNRPVVTFVILAPDQVTASDGKTTQWIEGMTRECGDSSRVFKSALVWCLPDPSGSLPEDTRKVLAWEDIDDERSKLRLDETQQGQLDETLKKARRDLKESVWRAYKSIMLLGKDNKLHTIEFGLVHSSSADTLVNYILNRLTENGEVEKGSVSANFLARNWSGAFTEWSTRAVRDAFFASPLFPRLLNPESIKETIARGVVNGQIAYVGKSGDDYEPFMYGSGASLSARDVEISNDMFIITKDTAEAYMKAKSVPPPSQPVKPVEPPTIEKPYPTGGKPDVPGPHEGGQEQPASTTSKQPDAKPQQLPLALKWEGDIPAQKWMNFYMRALTGFATNKGLKLRVSVKLNDEAGISQQKIDEMRAALKELGLSGDVEAD